MILVRANRTWVQFNCLKRLGVERHIGAYTKRANKFGNSPLGNSIGVLLEIQVSCIHKMQVVESGVSHPNSLER